MSYADDLARDRDKYRRQAGMLMHALDEILRDPTPRQLAAARKVLRKIEAEWNREIARAALEE